MDADDPEVIVDTEMSFEDYVKQLFRFGELCPRAQTAAMHAEVAIKVAQKAKEAFNRKKFDVAFLMSARCAHIVESTQLLKKKGELENFPCAPQLPEVRAALRECLDRIQLLQSDAGKLKQIHIRLMEKVRRDSAARQEVLKKQFEQDKADDEETLRIEHERRRQTVLAKHEPSVVDVKPTPSPVTEQEVFHDQQKLLLVQAEEQRLAAYSARLTGRSIPPPSQPAEQPVKLSEETKRQTPPPVLPTINSMQPTTQPSSKAKIPTIQTVAVTTDPSAKSCRRLTFVQPTAQELSSRLRIWDYNSSNSAGQSRRGMVNLGNTCYLNSVCQCLAQTMLARYFRSDEYISSIVNRYEGGGRIANTFSYVVRELTADGVLLPVSPSPLKMSVGRAFDTFSNTSQQDANEFLRCLLDGIHEDLNENSGAKLAPVDIENTKGSDTEIAQRYFSDYTKRNRSIIVSLFAFQERSALECPRCNRCTRSFAVAMGIEVPIPLLNRAVSIEDCIAQYCSQEILDENSLYQCSGCKTGVRASKQMSFYSLPEVLVISIKRFRAYGNFSDKISTPVAFQQHLDLTPFTCCPGQQTQFKLVGVVNHQGNIHGGHYTADSCGIIDQQWYSFSDEAYRPAQRPDFKLAYMLFYSKVALS